MGLFKDTPKPPAPIDIEGVIQKQADVNRVNQTTPFGSTMFQQGDNGQWESVFNFSPDLQPLFAQSVNLAGGTGLNNPLIDQVFDRGLGLLNRSFDIQEDKLRQSLADRGLPEDSEAFNVTFRDQFQDPRERAIESLAFNAINAGNQQRVSDMNAINSLLGRGQIAPTTPLDVTGVYAMNQNQANSNYLAEMQRQNNMFNTLGNLGAAYFL